MATNQKRKFVVEIEEIEHEFKRIHLTTSRTSISTSVSRKTALQPLIPYPTLQEQASQTRSSPRGVTAISTITTTPFSGQRGPKSPTKPPASPSSSSRKVASATPGNNSAPQLLESIPETDDEPPLDDTNKIGILDTDTTKYPSIRPKLRLKRLQLATSEFTFRSPLPSSSTADDFQSWTANYKLNPEHAQLILYSPTAGVLTSPSTSTTGLIHSASKANTIASAPPILKYSSAPSPTATGYGLLQTLEFDNSLVTESTDSDVQMDTVVESSIPIDDMMVMD